MNILARMFDEADSFDAETLLWICLADYVSGEPNDLLDTFTSRAQVKEFLDRRKQ